MLYPSNKKFQSCLPWPQALATTLRFCEPASVEVPCFLKLIHWKSMAQLIYPLLQEAH